MKDSIEIPGIPADTKIGVTPGERMQPQCVLLDLVLELDLAAAAESDSIGDAVDYEELARQVITLAEERPRALLERLAEDVASHLLAEYPLDAVSIRVRKPGALKHLGVEYAAVAIRRERAGSN